MDVTPTCADATPRRGAAHHSQAWIASGKQAAVALALVGSTVFAGPVPQAAAAPSAPSSDRLASSTTPDAADENEGEQALGALLATEYAGAVTAPDVEALVRRVGHRLRQDASPPERLLRTTEAVSRRALTDFLARRVALPIG